MKKREAFDLKWPLAYWNLLLAVFSLIGAIRVVPHLIYLTATQGLGVVACGAPEPLYGNAAVGFWVQAFILSKLFELIDTVFIVLRKKPLNFLHWYHHVTVLLFTWFCYTNENPGIIFVAMNYSVHAVMYGKSSNQHFLFSFLVYEKEGRLKTKPPFFFLSLFRILLYDGRQSTPFLAQAPVHHRHANLSDGCRCCYCCLLYHENPCGRNLCR